MVFLLEIVFRQLRVCYFIAPSLMRGRVYNLLLLLVFASAVPLGSESRGNQDHILLSQVLRLPQSGGPGPRIYIPQEQGGSVITPGTGFPFCRLLRLAGLRRRHSIPPPHGSRPHEVEVNLRPSVSRPATNFSFSLKFPSDSCGFVIL
jgi:hypothetical protein